jgi:alpha-methylacyl-CoA racemase
VIDAAVLDGVASLTAFSHGLAHLGVWGTERGTTPADGSMPFYDTYETADGEYLAVGALEPKFYAVLLERLGVPAERFPQDDRSCWPQLRAALSGAFRSRTRDDWDKEFQGLDACVTPVLRLREAPDHPHNQARNLFVEVAGQLQPNVAPRLSRTPGEVGTAPPAQGADTVSVLRELDYSDAEIRDLLNSGVARQAADAGQHPDDSGERESRVSVSIAPGR